MNNSSLLRPSRELENPSKMLNFPVTGKEESRESILSPGPRSDRPHLCTCSMTRTNHLTLAAHKESNNHILKTYPRIESMFVEYLISDAHVSKLM